MITQIQIQQFPAWWKNYLNSNGTKAVQNLRPNDLKIPFPQATNDELNKIYSYIITETKKINANAAIDLNQLQLVPLTGLEEATQVLNKIVTNDATPVLLLAALVAGAWFLLKK